MKTPDQQLRRAALDGDLAALNQLLASGCDVNMKDGKGWTALMIAVSRLDIHGAEAVLALLAAGADANARAEKGSTALTLAAEKGHVEVVKALHAAGADVNARTDKGLAHNFDVAVGDRWTALMLAAEKGHVEVVKALHAAGAEVNAKDTDGRTALMIAASSHDIHAAEAVPLLLNVGADANAKDNNGWTALMCNLRYPRHMAEEVVDALRSAGAVIAARLPGPVPAVERWFFDEWSDYGDADTFYACLSRLLIAIHGPLVVVEYLSHYPKFEIKFTYDDQWCLYSGQRSGRYDIHRLALGYDGEGPRCAQIFLAAAGYNLTMEQVQAIKPGDIITPPGTIVRG